MAVASRGRTGGCARGLGAVRTFLRAGAAAEASLQTEKPRLRIRAVVIANVVPGSAADQAQLRHGDVILEVNRKAVKDSAAFRAAVKGTALG